MGVTLQRRPEKISQESEVGVLRNWCSKKVAVRGGEKAQD